MIDKVKKFVVDKVNKMTTVEKVWAVLAFGLVSFFLGTLI